VIAIVYPLYQFLISRKNHRKKKLEKNRLKGDFKKIKYVERLKTYFKIQSIAFIAYALLEGITVLPRSF